MENKIVTIYELIGLIKDGKAPKKIKINNQILYFNENYNSIEELYFSDFGVEWYHQVYIKLDTKVEILPEENDEWEDIEEIEILDFSKEPNDNLKNIAIIINQLIKNQKYLKERLDNVKDDGVFDYWKDKIVGKNE